MACSDCDLAYFAGILDGEGCFSINLTHHGGFTIAITITNTDRSLLANLQSKFGGKIYSEKFRNRRWKRSFILRWDGLRAKEVAKKVVPFLFLKQNHAKLFIGFPMEEPGHSFLIKEDHELREAIFCKVKEFNKKGVDEEEGTAVASS